MTFNCFIAWVLISQTLLFAETLAAFWRDFIVILNSDPKFTDELMDINDLFSSKEMKVFMDYTPPGEKTTNLLLYLLKMKIKYSTHERDDFGNFLEKNSPSFNVLNKQWNELSKSFNKLLNCQCLITPYCFYILP